MTVTGLYDPRQDLPEDYPYGAHKFELTDPVRLQESGDRARKRSMLNLLGQAAIQLGLADAYPGEELVSAVVGMDLYAVMSDPTALVDGVTVTDMAYSKDGEQDIVDTVIQKFLDLHPDDVESADNALKMQAPHLSGWLDSTIQGLIETAPTLNLDARRMRRGAALLRAMHIQAANTGGIPAASVLS